MQDILKFIVSFAEIPLAPARPHHPRKQHTPAAAGATQATEAAVAEIEAQLHRQGLREKVSKGERWQEVVRALLIGSRCGARQDQSCVTGHVLQADHMWIGPSHSSTFQLHTSFRRCAGSVVVPCAATGVHTASAMKLHIC
jgi:hypothetical protein